MNSTPSASSTAVEKPQPVADKVSIVGETKPTNSTILPADAPTALTMKKESKETASEDDIAMLDLETRLRMLRGDGFKSKSSAARVGRVSCELRSITWTLKAQSYGGHGSAFKNIELTRAHCQALSIMRRSLDELLFMMAKQRPPCARCGELLTQTELTGDCVLCHGVQLCRDPLDGDATIEAIIKTVGYVRFVYGSHILVMWRDVCLELPINNDVWALFLETCATELYHLADIWLFTGQPIDNDIDDRVAFQLRVRDKLLKRYQHLVSDWTYQVDEWASALDEAEHEYALDVRAGVEHSDDFALLTIDDVSGIAPEVRRALIYLAPYYEVVVKPTPAPTTATSSPTLTNTSTTTSTSVK